LHFNSVFLVTTERTRNAAQAPRQMTILCDARRTPGTESRIPLYLKVVTPLGSGGA